MVDLEHQLGQVEKRLGDFEGMPLRLISERIN